MMQDNKRFLMLLQTHGGYLYDLFLYSEKAISVRDLSYRKQVSRSKVLPKNFQNPVDILVVGGKVAMISFQTQVVIVIEDAAIAKAQKMMLQSLWKKTPTHQPQS